MPEGTENEKTRKSMSWLRPMFGKVPYQRWEWLLMRTLFAWLCIWPTTLPSAPLSTVEQPAPNGIAQFFELTFLAGPEAFKILSWVVPALLVIYVIGILPFLATLGLFAVHVALGTLANSQGAIHHTGQIVGYVLLAQIICHAWKWVRCLSGRESLLQTRAHHHRDLIYFSQQGMAAAYVVAGLSKIINSGWEWVQTIPNMVLQIEKNHMMNFHNHLEKPPGQGGEFAADLIINHPTVAKMMLVGGLLLELFCFLALWNRLTLALFGAALFAMHMFISSAMNLGFLYNKSALAIFFVGPLITFAICIGIRSIRDRG